MQPKFSNVFTQEMPYVKTTQTPAAAENEKWLRLRFSQIFDSGTGSERKTQDPAGVDSEFVATCGVDPSGTLKLGYCFRLFNNSS